MASGSPSTGFGLFFKAWKLYVQNRQERETDAILKLQAENQALRVAMHNIVEGGFQSDVVFGVTADMIEELYYRDFHRIPPTPSFFTKADVKVVKKALMYDEFVEHVIIEDFTAYCLKRVHSALGFPIQVLWWRESTKELLALQLNFAIDEDREFLDLNLSQLEEQVWDEWDDMLTEDGLDLDSKMLFRTFPQGYIGNYTGPRNISRYEVFDEDTNLQSRAEFRACFEMFFR